MLILIILLIVLVVALVAGGFYCFVILPAQALSESSGIPVGGSILLLLFLVVLCMVGYMEFPSLVPRVMADPLDDTGATIGAVAFVTTILHLCTCLLVSVGRGIKRTYALTAPWIWVLPVSFGLSRATMLVGDKGMMQVLDLTIAGSLLVVPFFFYKGFYGGRLRGKSQAELESEYRKILTGFDLYLEELAGMTDRKSRKKIKSLAVRANRELERLWMEIGKRDHGYRFQNKVLKEKGSHRELYKILKKTVGR